MITFTLLLFIGSWLSAPTWYTVLCVIGMAIKLAAAMVETIKAFK